MREVYYLVATCVLLTMFACRGASDDSSSNEPTMATSITVTGAGAEPGTAFYAPLVEVMESMPVQFAISLTREMPMPGCEVIPGSINIDKATKRIVVKMHEKQPDGAGLMVMTPTKVRLSFGSLETGAYSLDLLLRVSGSEKHEKVQTLTLTAR